MMAGKGPWECASCGILADRPARYGCHGKFESEHAWQRVKPPATCDERWVFLWSQLASYLEAQALGWTTVSTHSQNEEEFKIAREYLDRARAARSRAIAAHKRMKQRARAERLDLLHGTPCEQIRHQQEIEQIAIWLERGWPDRPELADGVRTGEYAP